VAIERLGQNRIDGGQYILDTMIELGDQHPLLVLGPPSLRYVDIDTEHAQRAAVGLEGNEAARLDPPDLALAAKNAIIDGILAEALLNRLVPHVFDAGQIFRMPPAPPLAPPGLPGSLGQTVQRRVAFRYLHHICVGIVSITPNACRLAGKR